MRNNLKLNPSLSRPRIRIRMMPVTVEAASVTVLQRQPGHRDRKSRLKSITTHWPGQMRRLPVGCSLGLTRSLLSLQKLQPRTRRNDFNQSQADSSLKRQWTRDFSPGPGPLRQAIIELV
mmetsp:Transcript_13107/g.25727  ORF Transcript_13107/g.25727 Transcript_13107/m.25727 type:complete len:120 (+) Transcript_13107:99-458(+)